MSDHVTGSGRFPTLPSMHDIEKVLAAVSALEVALVLEIRRLSAVHAPSPRPPGAAQHKGRPLWWWRAMLVTWLFSPDVEEYHSGDVLRGLRQAVKQWSDGELAQFIEQLSANRMSVARKEPA
jgi:hypothetical protein